MKTTFLLLAEFETGQIPLEAICEKYLSMDIRRANRLAQVQQLPFPVFRAGSQKSPWLVKIEDLAGYLDQQHAAAVADWKKMQAAINDASHHQDANGYTAEGSPSSHAA